MRWKILVLWAGVIAASTAFAAPETSVVNFYLEHPERLQAAYEHCQSEADFSLPPCKDILQARRHMMRWFDIVGTHPQRFGMKIIALQQRLLTLEAEHAGEQQLHHERQRLSHYFAFVRFCHGLR